MKGGIRLQLLIPREGMDNNTYAHEINNYVETYRDNLRMDFRRSINPEMDDDIAEEIVDGILQRLPRRENESSQRYISRIRRTLLRIKDDPVSPLSEPLIMPTPPPRRRSRTRSAPGKKTRKKTSKLALRGKYKRSLKSAPSRRRRPFRQSKRYQDMSPESRKATNFVYTFRKKKGGKKKTRKRSIKGGT